MCATMLMPVPARAAEEPAPIMLFAPDIHTRIAPARNALVAPAPQEIRLSSGAKTAIIVTAIVVGALIIVGVLALHHPHGP